MSRIENKYVRKFGLSCAVAILTVGVAVAVIGSGAAFAYACVWLANAAYARN